MHFSCPFLQAFLGFSLLPTTALLGLNYLYFVLGRTLTDQTVWREAIADAVHSHIRYETHMRRAARRRDVMASMSKACQSRICHMANGEIYQRHAMRWFELLLTLTASRYSSRSNYGLHQPTASDQISFHKPQSEALARRSARWFLQWLKIRPGHVVSDPRPLRGSFQAASTLHALTRLVKLHCECSFGNELFRLG